MSRFAADEHVPEGRDVIAASPALSGSKRAETVDEVLMRFIAECVRRRTMDPPKDEP